MTKLVALLTDFGTTDTYVGVMKGVMLNICPDLQLVDLTHAIQPQNIKQAAFTLLNSYRYFPSKTIFLVVVDPGVGSSRKPIAMIADGEWFFVAPDNGVLSYIIRDAGTVTVTLDDSAYRLEDTSNTFHGRDIFAPAAAHLANGTAFEKLGRLVERPVLLPEPILVVDADAGLISGEVLHIDHFGSAVTSIGLLEWSDTNRLMFEARFGDEWSELFSAREAVITIGNQEVRGIRRTYAEADPGRPLALVGSSGYLELSVNGGSFAALSGMKIGAPVQVRIEG